jgi:hypothetical protein
VSSNQALRLGGCETTMQPWLAAQCVTIGRQSCLEHSATVGESPVADSDRPIGSHLKYNGTRDILLEAGATIAPRRGTWTDR